MTTSNARLLGPGSRSGSGGSPGSQPATYRRRASGSNGKMPEGYHLLLQVTVLMRTVGFLPQSPLL